MKHVLKIKLKAPMNSKAAKWVFEVLQDGRQEPQVLFVGGCVRNAILGEAVSDIDLATRWTPEQVMALLKKAGIKVIPTGLDHGTVTAVLEGEHFQITTLRQDVETDGRHAVVAYTDDWAADAGRRDFTFNTLLAGIKGNVYDPLGFGVRDLERRKVVFVGDPETRIREDYLRILRFFRFHAWYGKGAPDKAGLQACAALSRNIKSLSKERVTQEVFKILSSPNPGKTFTLIQDNKILHGVINPKFEANHFNILKKIEKIDSIVLGLLILGNFSKSGTARIENALRLTNKQQKQLDDTLLYLKKFKVVSAHSLKLLLYRAGHETVELVLISRLLLEKAPPRKITDLVNTLRNMPRPVLPLRGQDLIDQGMQPGPGIKKALETFERSWIRGNFE